MNDPTEQPDQSLGSLVIHLLKGVLYQETDTQRWEQLLRLQARVRDYVAVMGLELVLDEAESYAFLRTLEPDDEEASSALPRLMARRQLSFPVSLLLALLRKKLAEFDVSGNDTRLVLSRDEIVDLLRIFLPDSSNEARLVDQVDRHISKVLELGFLYQLKTSDKQQKSYEVRRIIKAFVDAQWLAGFDEQLKEYRQYLEKRT